MAEFVQQSIEEMLPELQQMERVGLFTKEESRQILRRRKRYEYKLRRRTKCKEDFLQYIQYEINVLGLLKLRRKKTGYSFKKLEIEVAIVHRIHQLFQLVTTRFKDDVKLWLTHIEFSKERGEKSVVGRLFTDMLQIHNKKPGLWIKAAKWEFEDNANVESGRSLLQRGLRFNNESKQLWQEYYRFELLFTEKMQKRREILGGAVDDTQEEGEFEDAVLDGSVAKVVYNQALQAIPDDIEFLLSFIPIAQLFDFTQSPIDCMIEDLQARFPQSELTWSAVAKQHLHDQEILTNKLSKKDKYEQIEKCEERCFHVFEEAVTKVQTEFMWTEYLNVCLERQELKGSPALQEKRRLRVLEVFKQAWSCDLLSPELTIKWLEILEKCGKIGRCERVCTEATDRFPTNLHLWKYRLTLQISTLRDETGILQIVDEARKKLHDRESWTIWEITLQYLISIDSSSTEKYFKICTSSPVRELCVPAKLLYLQWAGVTTGLEKARKVYHSLIKVKPVSVEFYEAMIQLEMSQASPKMKKIRQIYEEAIQDFGSEDIDLWLNYIKLELTEMSGRSENAGSLHFRAMKTLCGSNVERFVTKYTLLQTGHIV